MKCIPQKDLAKYLVGEVTRSRAEEIEEHLSACGVCRKELDNLREMVGRIGAPSGPAEERDHLPEIRRRIETGDTAHAGGRRRWPVIAAAVALLALLAAGVVFLLQTKDDEFGVKSDRPPIAEQDRWAGIRAYTVGESGRPAVLTDAYRKGDYLVFSYSNLGDNPYDYMMIFAIDENGRVYWYHPAYSDEAGDPASVKISRGADGIELKEQIRHDYPAGRLWVYGLFTNKPMKVRTIEQLLKNTELGERIALEGSAQHILVTEVKP